MGNKPAAPTCHCEYNAELVDALDDQCGNACKAEKTTASQLHLMLCQLDRAMRTLETEWAHCPTHRVLQCRQTSALPYYYFRSFELDAADQIARQQQGEITQGEKTPCKEKEDGEREDSQSAPF